MARKKSMVVNPNAENIKKIRTHKGPVFVLALIKNDSTYIQAVKKDVISLLEDSNNDIFDLVYEDSKLYLDPKGFFD